MLRLRDEFGPRRMEGLEMVMSLIMLAALIGLMFFGSMASAFSEMRREQHEGDDMPVMHS